MRVVSFLTLCLSLTACLGPEVDMEEGGDQGEVTTRQDGLLLSTPGAAAVPSTDFADLPLGAVFHVATTGNDGNPGTASLPWRTVNKAAAALRPGQTAYVHAGTYFERVDLVYRAVDGTATAPIRLRAAPGERVVLKGGDSQNGAMVKMGRRFWEVNGFVMDVAGSRAMGVHVEAARNVVIRNCDIFGGSAPEGIGLSNGAADVAIVGNKVHGFTWGAEEAHGILVLPDTARVLVKNNESWGNTGDSFQCVGPDVEGYGATPQDITIEGNRFHEDQENAVDIKTCTRLTIRNNKFYGYRPKSTAPQGSAMVVHYSASKILIEGNRLWNNGRALTLGGTQVWSTPVTDVVIRRNLVFDHTTASGGSGDGVRIGTSAQVRVYNNTFSGMPNGGVRVGDGSSGPAVDTQVFNNIFFNTGRALEVYLTGVTRLVSDRNVAFNASSAVQVRLDGTNVAWSTWVSRSAQDKSSVLANPQFVADPYNNDFYTVAGSPARDRAISTTTTALSVCGAGPDVGFLESCL